MFWTKRRWILATQAGMGAAMALLAFALPMPFFFQASIALLWLLAFLSATHDIAADGFYMLALPQHTQAAFVGIRSVFWRLAMVVAEGPLVVAAGLLERTYGIREGWAATMGLCGIVFVVVFAYHLCILPTPAADRAARKTANAPSVAEALGTYWGCWPPSSASQGSARRSRFCCSIAWPRPSSPSSSPRSCWTPSLKVGSG